MAAAINILTSKSSNCFKMSFQNGVPVETSTQTQNKRGSQPVIAAWWVSCFFPRHVLGAIYAKAKKKESCIFFFIQSKSAYLYVATLSYNILRKLQQSKILASSSIGQKKAPTYPPPLEALCKSMSSDNNQPAMEQSCSNTRCQLYCT